MSFLFPWFLVGALAVVVPIVLHFFARDRAPRLPFSDVRFLERAFVRRDRRRRLRELLLLALRVGALLLLAFAFGRPFLADGGDARRVTVVAVDRSLSLSAPGQMALVRERALETLTGVPAGESVAVVAFDDTAEVMAQPAATRQLARSAIERIVPTAGGTRYPAGLSAAVDLLGGRPGRIVVVTDLQAAGWTGRGSAAVPAQVDVEVSAVPPVERNLAVTAARSEAAGLVAVMLNAASESVETEAMLSLDGREVGRRRVTLVPGENDVRWEQTLDPATVAAISVADRNGYRWDDTRFAFSRPASPTVVHVVANSGTLEAEAFYLSQALGAAPESRPFELRPVAPAGLAAADAAGWRTGDVVVVIGTDGLRRPGRARIAGFVEAGGGLLLAIGGGVDPLLARDLLGTGLELEIEASMTTGADGAPGRLAIADPRHPVFRPFGNRAATFTRARFTRTALVDLADPAGAAPDLSGPPHVLARFDSGDPALIEYRRGNGRALVFASDLSMDGNDLPRHPGFVPFLQEIVRYLAGPEDLPLDLLPADVPAGVPPVPGVATDPASGRRLAVNADARESDPRALTPEAFLARVEDIRGEPAGRAAAAVDGASRESEQSLWWYFLLAMALVLVGEAWLGRNMA
jgi:hypothetical protein